MSRTHSYSPVVEYATTENGKDKTTGYCRIDGNGSLLFSARPPARAVRKSVLNARRSAPKLTIVKGGKRKG